MTITETGQAEVELLEAEAVKATKALADQAGIALGELIATDLNLDLPDAVKRKLGEAALIGHKRHSVKSRTRRKPDPTILDYHGLEGTCWATYLQVANAYEHRVPTSDRDDIRHDIMVELDHAERRDGKPLPILRAYRIASLTVALYWRSYNRFSTRVCVYNGYPVEPLCKGCQNSTGKPCAWLAVRPVASLDSEIIDPDGYATKLMDTVASDSAIDMPDRWFDINELKSALPLRLVEIAYKKLDGKPLDKKDQKYLERYRKKAQLSLF